jgi:hypothetical protein
MALTELKQGAKVHGRFSNITDEDIERADDELKPKDEMFGGPGLPGFEGRNEGQPPTKDSDFVESEHPRDEEGEFAEGLGTHKKAEKIKNNKLSGGQSVEKLKNNVLQKEDDIKEWLYENVDHWTWINSQPISLLRNNFNRIPEDKQSEAAKILNDYESAIDNKNAALRTYQSKAELSDFSIEELSQAITYSDMQTATGWDEIRQNTPKGQKPIGPERVYFRFGKPPESGKSFNSMSGQNENGVSVYVTPVSGSLAGFNNREIYYGKGRQIDTGGDDEPVIKVTGAWQPMDKKLMAKIKKERNKPTKDSFLARTWQAMRGTI